MTAFVLAPDDAGKLLSSQAMKDEHVSSDLFMPGLPLVC
jgi:hypothetical protein